MLWFLHTRIQSLNCNGVTENYKYLVYTKNEMFLCAIYLHSWLLWFTKGSEAAIRACLIQGGTRSRFSLRLPFCKLLCILFYLIFVTWVIFGFAALFAWQLLFGYWCKIASFRGEPIHVLLLTFNHIGINSCDRSFLMRHEWRLCSCPCRLTMRMILLLWFDSVIEAMLNEYCWISLNHEVHWSEFKQLIWLMIGTILWLFFVSVMTKLLLRQSWMIQWLLNIPELSCWVVQCINALLNQC